MLTDMIRHWRDEERAWKSSRDALAVTFLSIATPLSLGVEMPSACLQSMKASISLAALGIFLSILERIWRHAPGPEAGESPRGLRRMLLSLAGRLWLGVHERASRWSTVCLVLSFVSLIVAVWLR